jgi:undecaprenyl-diphosphatase
MTTFQAFILGIIQGLGEFLPISSSGHLIAVPWLLNWPEHTLEFDVALHFGTLISVAAFFWRDWIILIREGLTKGLKNFEGKMFWFLVAATIPGGIIGKLLEDYAESIFRNPILISITLSVMGIILYLTDKYCAKDKDFEKIDFKSSFLIGLSQAIAIIPGVSRSGITMSTGRLLGLTREATAKYSFLLSTPIIFGATVFKVKDIAVQAINMPFIVGVITSAVVGLLGLFVYKKYILK